MAIQVVQLTDTHLFEDDTQTSKGVATVRSFEAVLAHMQRVSQPDLILLTGDLSQDETAGSYQRLYRAIAPLNIPAYWIPGNHDQPPLMQQVLSQPPFSADKRIDAGEWVILLLNSAVPEQVHGELSAESLAWLKDNLESAGSRPVLISLHHPPVTIGSAWMDRINLRNADVFQHVIRPFPSVKGVLCGHIHQEFDQAIAGVRYLATPSTCVQFQPNFDECMIDGDRPPGFRQLTLHPDGSFATHVIRVDDAV